MTARRRRAVALTPLIDVMFLLLLFFMLTASFTREGEIALPRAPAGGRSAPAPAFLEVSAGALRLDRRLVGLGELPSALRAAGAATVVVALGPDVDAQRLVDVLAALARGPAVAMALID